MEEVQGVNLTPPTENQLTEFSRTERIRLWGGSIAVIGGATVEVLNATSQSAKLLASTVVTLAGAEMAEVVLRYKRRG